MSAENEIWAPSGDYYCPNCGKQTMWKEQSEGDYYLGPEFICLTCEAVSFLSSTCMPPQHLDFKRLEQIRKALPKI